MQHIEIVGHITTVVRQPNSAEKFALFADHIGQPEPGGVCSRELRQAQDILTGAAQVLLNWQ